MKVPVGNILPHYRFGLQITGENPAYQTSVHGMAGKPDPEAHGYTGEPLTAGRFFPAVIALKFTEKYRVYRMPIYPGGGMAIVAIDRLLIKQGAWGLGK